MLKKTRSLDEVARRFADGHYVEQSLPIVNPKRDLAISQAISQMKKKKLESAHRQG